MPDPNLPLLEDAVRKLAPFLDEIVFVGGVTLGLLITDEAAAPIRSDHYLDEVLSCFNALQLTGIGAKSSAGLGAFHIIEPPQQCDWLSKL